jgi:hypothetical protein
MVMVARGPAGLIPRRRPAGLVGVLAFPDRAGGPARCLQREIAMSDNSGPAPTIETTADQARQVAERIRHIHLDVTTSFQFRDASQRVKMIQQVGLEIVADFFPVLSWIERRRSVETARLVQQRVDNVLRMAVEAAAQGVPDKTVAREVAHAMGFPSKGVAQAAALLVTARLTANWLDDWASDIEHEDARRRAREHLGGGKKNKSRAAQSGQQNSAMSSNGRSPGRKPLAEKHPRKWQIYQVIWAAIDKCGGAKKALSQLKECPEYKQLREQIKELGLNLDSDLIESARSAIRRPRRGRNSQART